jgi:dynein heavy chain
VSRTIGPKKLKLQGAQDSADKAEAAAAKAAAELATVQAQVADLEAKLAAAQKKGEQLEADMEMATTRLGRAEKLVGGLGAEAVRWESAQAILNDAIKFLIGDVIVASGFIAYIGPFTSTFREEVVKDWVESVKKFEITANPKWTLAETLVDPAEVRDWNIHALPTDALSTDNAIIVTRGRRWPLMIDPQSQANKWVRKMGLDGHNLQVIKLSEPTFLRTLENGIRYGQHVLLENVQEVLDPSLEPVLTKAIVKKGGQMILRLGSEDVPYSEEFSFFITTKLANPHYLPEICIKVTVINFTVTQEGLVDQLTGTTVGHERPDLEETRVKLVVQIAADKAELDRIEQLILRLLAESEGDILADEAVIHALDQSKVTTDGVKERMVVADETMKTIDDARTLYEPVAVRAAQIYFVVADMALIDPMYQWSLSYFISFFMIRMGASDKHEDVKTRVQLIIDDLTYYAYVDTCQGLFEDHKMVFSFLVMCSILRSTGAISESGWLYYLRGYQAAQGWIGSDFQTPAGPDWMPEDTWNQVVAYAEMCRIENPNAAVKDIPADMVGAKSAEWKAFYDDDNMCDQKMPSDFESQLTPFQRFLMCRTLRENTGLIALKQVVDAEMGQQYVETPAFNLQATYNNSTCGMPLIFILVAGADPTAMLVKLANDNKYGERLHILSLGQGQGPKAEHLIKDGWETGDWVCLQNCHLSASWMPTFERIMEGIKPDDIDQDYRLWLTSMPSKTFPVPVLQTGIKMTIEPPKGLKFNMTRSFADIQPETWESANDFGNGFGKGREFKKLIFALCFFHAVILERRKFGPIGWNIPYEWMQSDLLVSMEQVHMYLAGQEGVPFQTLRYIVAEVNYGGRVTDDKDVRLISAVVARYFETQLLDDAFLLSSLKEYYAPPEGSLDEARAYIKQLPGQENPRVFGLHQNALITAQINQVRTFQNTVVDVQPRIASGGGSGKSPEEIVQEMVEDFSARIPKIKKEKEAHELTYALDSVGAVTSLGVFHKQELERFAILEKAIKSSLKSLGLAIKGLVVMSAALEDMYKSFTIQRVPGNWIAKAYPCLKPLNSWVNDMIKRVVFINSWLTDGPPIYYWISSFFFPQGFMTASMQIYARQTRIAIDTLGFLTEVTKMEEDEVTEPAEFGVNLSGLYLQGCGWDKPNGILCESDKGVLFVQMPISWLKPMLISETEIQKAKDYACPLYKTSERRGVLSTTGHSTNFIGYVNLPTDMEDLGHWVRRGVALLCMLDD